MNKNGIYAPRCQMLNNSYCTAMGVKCFERRLIGGVQEGVCVGRSEATRTEPMPVIPQQIKGFVIDDPNVVENHIDADRESSFHRYMETVNRRAHSGRVEIANVDLPQGVPIENAAILSNEEFNARMDGFAAEPVFAEGGLVRANNVKEGTVPARLSPGEGFVNGESIGDPCDDGLPEFINPYKEEVNIVSPEDREADEYL